MMLHEQEEFLVAVCRLRQRVPMRNLSQCGVKRWVKNGVEVPGQMLCSTGSSLSFHGIGIQEILRKNVEQTDTRIGSISPGMFSQWQDNSPTQLLPAKALAMARTWPVSKVLRYLTMCLVHRKGHTRRHHTLLAHGA